MISAWLQIDDKLSVLIRLKNGDGFEAIRAYSNLPWKPYANLLYLDSPDDAGLMMSLIPVCSHGDGQKTPKKQSRANCECMSDVFHDANFSAAFGLSKG